METAHNVILDIYSRIMLAFNVSIPAVKLTILLLSIMFARATNAL